MRQRKVLMESRLICDICGLTAWQEHSGKLMRCGKCGLIRAKDNPTTEDLSRIYDEHYFFGEEYANYLEDRGALEKNFRRRIEQLRGLSALDAGSRVLEIGCAYGFFLRLLKGTVRSAIGYDIAEKAVAYAHDHLGVDARIGDFRTYDEGPIDVVCMWDVIEHMPNPGDVIENAARLMRPGGYIALTTGDIGSRNARRRGDAWRMVHPPTHLFYFDHESIGKLLEKHGLEIVTFRHCTIYRNMGSAMKQIINKRKREKKPIWLLVWGYRMSVAIGITRLNFGVNFYDIMEVIAKKKTP